MTAIDELLADARIPTAPREGFDVGAALLRVGLADMTATADGFLYGVTEEATSFLNALQSPYVGQLKERADWLTSTYMHEGTDVRDGMKQITQRWSRSLRAGTPPQGEGDVL